jgi:hypothetical protein
MKHQQRRAAIHQATELAFAPVAFQVARVMRQRGLLAALLERGPLTTEELMEATSTSRYGVETLCEAGISFGLNTWNGERWAITRTGRYIQVDEMTRVNMDFIHDVCFKGLFHLDEAIEDGNAAGLKVFGDWPTVYEALSQLPPHVQKSWFDFDHFYSDGAFPKVLPRVFGRKPKRLLDVGGNTGKWSMQCCNFDPDVQITILDLPGQLAKAQANIDAAGFTDRITGHPINILDADQPFPTGFDAVWMSQFLVCFALDEVRHILKRGAAALAEGGSLWIMDNYWDRQRNEVAQYALHGTSIYFTAIANGTSRVYSAEHMLECIEDAGLEVVGEFERLGVGGHTLWRCARV